MRQHIEDDMTPIQEIASRHRGVSGLTLLGAVHSARSESQGHQTVIHCLCLGLEELRKRPTASSQDIATVERTIEGANRGTLYVVPVEVKEPSTKRIPDCESRFMPRRWHDCLIGNRWK